ncbi:MAG: TetR/AcrR family transcriptional regulator [Woeseiaceae bacterium]|nr:TetR/AcrR family transcriptional regulator [Woeseiaceae bacterium]
MARPRNFDEDKALEAAMLTFWRHGYDGTTYKMLSEATGVDVKGLSNVFGSKDEIFDKAATAYRAMARRVVSQAFETPGIEALIAFFERLGTPPASEDDMSNMGCMLVNTIFELHRFQPNMREHVEAYRRMWLKAFETSLNASGIDKARDRAEFLVGSMWGALSEIRLVRSKTAAAPLAQIAVDTLRSWQNEQAA